MMSTSGVVKSVPTVIHARITGTGSYLPGAPVSNDDLRTRGIDTSDEWIVERTHSFPT